MPAADDDPYVKIMKEIMRALERKKREPVGYPGPATQSNPYGAPQQAGGGGSPWIWDHIIAPEMGVSGQSIPGAMFGVK